MSATLIENANVLPEDLTGVKAAGLLFVPINSPGETSLVSNLLVNAVGPVILLLFAARRIKLGIELS